MRKEPAYTTTSVEQRLAELSASFAATPTHDLAKWIVIKPDARALAFDIDEAANASSPRVVPTGQATKFKRLEARRVACATIDDDGNGAKAVHLRDAYVLSRQCLIRQLEDLQRPATGPTWHTRA